VIGGRRARQPLPAVTLVAAAAATATVVSAVPLFLGTRAEEIILAHVAAAIVFFSALAIKLALLGSRARLGRARRVWRLLLAQLGGALAAYTLLTGVVVLLDPAWSDQHLAASFWLSVVVIAHARQYRTRLRAFLGRSHTGDRELQHRLRRLDAATLSLLDLSVRKRLSDSRLALLLGTTVTEIRQRRRRAVTQLGTKEPRIERRLQRLPPEAWRLPPRLPRRKRLVVVGGGMAGHAVVKHMATRPGWQITLLGEEGVMPYNRIGLSQVLEDPRSAGALSLSPHRWYEEAAVEVGLRAPVSAVDLDGRRVIDERGRDHRYDALVMATGSRAFLPPIAGIEQSHVIGYRTLRDAERISAIARRARTAVVIGGGLLGLEAAAALSTRGLGVTVVEAAGRLMAEHLDHAAAALLRRSLTWLGIETALGTHVTDITASGVRLSNGTTLIADLVVVAAGIRTETALARSAGLHVERGIVVDDHMRTTAAAVWAVGECAQHRGVVHGLWAPLTEQVQAAVASIDGRSLPFRPRPRQTKLKVAGVEVYSAGRTTSTDGDDEILRSDGRRGTYAKLVVEGDRLVGAILVGNAAAASSLSELIAGGGPVPADVLDGSDVQRSRQVPGRRPPEVELMCRCAGVSRERIEGVIADGAFSVEDVGYATGAGMGCGSCVASVARVLERRGRSARTEGQVSGGSSSASRSKRASA
jgi:NADPH-dependent 2,4-dienoyl-CoA reductase/sulfur reductase-like enzyme/bacterioferritin-associated ferredoxin